MNKTIKYEKRIMHISFWTGVLFVLVELGMTLYSRSQSVLADTVYDAVELVLIALTIFIIPLFYKPISEKHPFGYAQLESIFILLKGFMFIAVMITLIVNNIQLILSGGNHIDHMQISIFESILSVFSILIFITLKRLSKKISSPIIEVEMYGWKLDVMASVGVSLAFLFSALMSDTSLSFLTPYFDQIVALTMAAVALPTPCKMVIESTRNLILFSPDEDTLQDIKDNTTNVLKEYPFTPVFYDITKTGRRLWISIYFTSVQDTLSFSQIEQANKQLLATLSLQYEHCYVELIPNILANAKKEVDT